MSNTNAAPESSPMETARRRGESNAAAPKKAPKKAAKKAAEEPAKS